jgi:hypothetical protein
MRDDVLDFYRSPGPLTSLGPHGRLVDALPADVADLCAVVPGLLLHAFWATRYGVTLPDERKAETNIRRLDRQVARLLEIDPSPLGVARPPGRRLVGTCRDFTTFAVALLRAKGVPARARCGFGTYFLPGHFEDHWVCEYWDAGAGRWRLVDAQLDALQRAALKIDFDPLDVPRDRFLTGGAAWAACREGRADPMKFGIEKLRGLWFVRGDLVRDFLALNKVDILPWDHGWGHLAGEDESAYPLMDRMARRCGEPDGSFDEIRALFAADPGFAPPPAILA